MSSTFKYIKVSRVIITSLLSVPTVYAFLLWMPLITFPLLGLIAVGSFILYSNIDNDTLIGIIRNLSKLHDLGFVGLTVFERTILIAWYIVIFITLYLLFPYDPSYSLFWAIDQWLFGQLFTLYLATIIVNDCIIARVYNKIRVEVIKRIEKIEKDTKEDSSK